MLRHVWFQNEQPSRYKSECISALTSTSLSNSFTLKFLSIMHVSSSLYIARLLACCAALPTYSARDFTPAPAIVVPTQLGPYPVSVYEHEIKTTRPDPLAPSPGLRRLMITIYRPFLDNFTCPPENQLRIPYIKPVVGDALIGSLLSGKDTLGSSSSNLSSILAPRQMQRLDGERLVCQRHDLRFAGRVDLDAPAVDLAKIGQCVNGTAHRAGRTGAVPCPFR